MDVLLRKYRLPTAHWVTYQRPDIDLSWSGVCFLNHGASCWISSLCSLNERNESNVAPVRIIVQAAATIPCQDLAAKTNTHLLVVCTESECS